LISSKYKNQTGNTMASKEDRDDEEIVEEKPPAKTISIKAVIIFVLLGILVSGGLVGGTLYFASSMYDSGPSSGAGKAGKSTDNDEEADEEEQYDAAGEGEEDGDETAEDGEGEEAAPVNYFSLDPKFVVSFSDQQSARFMQFSIEVMTRKPATIKLIEKHMPAVRSSLLMLFGSQKYDDMVTRDGKQKLLDEAARDIDVTLKKVTKNKKLKSKIEAAYFVSFVIQ